MERKRKIQQHNMADISRDKEKKNVDVKATSVEDLKLLQVDNIAWYDVHGA